MSTPLIAGETATEFLAVEAIQDSAAIQAFMEGLDPTQRRRFEGIAHHLVHVGFEDGQRHPDPAAMTPEQRLNIMVGKFNILNEGAAIAGTIKEI